jgi:hypothetical protein
MVAALPPSGASESLGAAVLAALRGSGYRVLRDVRCEVRGRSVVLSGVVPSYYLKQVAQSLALRVAQGQEVLNAVEVHGAG